MNNFHKPPHRDKTPPFDVLFRKFKRDLERSGKLKDLKKYEFHETKGQQDRRKKKEGVRRWQKICRDKFMERYPNGNIPKSIRKKRNFG